MEGFFLSTFNYMGWSGVNMPWGCSLISMSWVVFGLDMRFLGRKWQKENAKAKSKAINQSLRPSGFTPAFGRAVTPFGTASYGTAEAVPLSKAVLVGWKRQNQRQRNGTGKGRSRSSACVEDDETGGEFRPDDALARVV
jgi:hypothetical protein